MNRLFKKFDMAYESVFIQIIRPLVCILIFSLLIAPEISYGKMMMICILGLAFNWLVTGMIQSAWWKRLWQ